MGITGNLKTMVLAELLQWLSQGQKSGTLVIDNGAVEKRVYFENGMIVSSASTDPSEYLGNFLVSHGLLTEEQVDEALARQAEEQKLIGRLLVDLGAIAEEDLHQMLQFKAEEAIYDVFTWPEGDFRFLDGELPEEAMVPISLDVQWIVLEGSRRLDELRRLREHVPSAEHVPVSLVDLGALEVEAEGEARILGFVDDDKTVGEICKAAASSIVLVSQALANQVVDGTVKLVRPRFIEVPVPAELTDAEPTGSHVAHPIAMPNYPPAGFVPIPTPPGAQAGWPQPMMPGSAPAAVAAPAAAPAAVQQAAVPAAPPAPTSEADSILQLAEESLKKGDLDTALATFRRARDAGGPEVVSAVETGERQIQEALERDGIKLTAVPRLSCSMDRLMELEISPQEGFMLTRVNGSYDLKSLLKMNPGPQLETQMLFWRLRRSGHVAF